MKEGYMFLNGIRDIEAVDPFVKVLAHDIIDMQELSIRGKELAKRLSIRRHSYTLGLIKSRWLFYWF